MLAAALALGACNSDEFIEEEPLSNVEASSRGAAGFALVVGTPAESC